MSATETVVRIYVAMSELMSRAIKHTLPTFISKDTYKLVENAEVADLVIFDSVHQIEDVYDPRKTYAFIKTPANWSNTPNLPENCVSVDVMSLLPGLNIAMVEAGTRILKNRLAEPLPVADEVSIPIRPDALRVLVIDDTPEHLRSARTGLAGNHVTTAKGYREAMQILSNEKFDVVLTDLHMPMSSQTLSEKSFKLGELVPYGILLMVEAARKGTSFVGVVTDLNHHNDPFSAAFDHYSRFHFYIENAKVKMMHAPMNPDGSKNWSIAMMLLTEDD